MTNLELGLLFLSAGLAGLVGIVVGLLAGIQLVSLKWRINATSPDIVRYNNKTLKVVDIESNWSRLMLQKCIDEAQEKSTQPVNKEKTI